ncbi:hypothetical protein AeNC1_007643 [Aphanomyces euteiches]|nr:hypothetical protein AeNC1_007643 [Aphanomyces euteiches]
MDVASSQEVDLSKKHHKKTQHHNEEHERKHHGHSDSSLKILVSLSRHGSRRPNGITSVLCPNNKENALAYEVPPEELTEIGMEQMRLAGREVRREYIDNQGFLSNSISGPERKHFETYFRSDAANRCAQSAISMGYGLYPEGTGPRGFYHQPIAVYMELLKNEHEFAAPKGPCKAVLKADIKTYFDTRAQELIEEHRPMLEKVGELCGVSVWDIPNLRDGEDIVMGIKDIADTFTFDTQQGLHRMKGLTPELQSEIEGLAFQNLMERYYSTNREITYWVGGFPTLLLKNLQIPPPEKAEKSFKYYSYHGHRELLHGMGMLLGWKFDFKGQPRAMNNTALDPATTLFFELHEVNTTQFIRTFVWSPRHPRSAVKLEKCSSLDCPLAEFTSIIQNHIRETGTWEEICNYQKATFAPVLQPTTSPITTDAPEVAQTTKKPKETTARPVETTEKPVTTTLKPATTHETTTKPLETTKEPVPVTTEAKTTPVVITTTAPTTTKATEPPTTTVKPLETLPPTTSVETSPITTFAPVTTTAPPALRLVKLDTIQQQPPLSLFEGLGWASYLAVVGVLVYFAAKRYNRRQQTGYRRLD